MNVNFNNLDDVIVHLEKIKSDGKLKSTSNHSLYWVFIHLSQSIDYSIYGYPKNKMRLVQLSLGKFIFKVFSLLGKMSHSLDSPIPGAPVIPESGKWQDAVDKLINSINFFKKYDGDLAPHFTYGYLNKEQYSRAHIFHIVNHFKSVKGASIN